MQISTKKTIELILKEARNLAIKEMLPTNKIGDEVGVKLEDGKVIVPEEFHRIYELLKEGEWIGMSENPDWGGQGMPRSVAMAAGDFFYWCKLCPTALCGFDNWCWTLN